MAIDRITTGAVLDGAIQTADIANLAIDNDKLATNAVTAEKMAPGAAFVTGMVMPYAGVVDNGSNPVPSGWLLCDGSEQDASVYVALKNLLQTTYGPYSNGSGGTGTTHFRVPDLRGKVIAASLAVVSAYVLSWKVVVEVMVVPVTAAGVFAPIVAPSILPPSISGVLISGEDKVLFDSVSCDTKLTNVEFAPFGSNIVLVTFSL